MDQSNNKKRLLALIEILKKESNEDKKLSLNEIIALLEKRNITINNRKTLYDDFKILNEYGINVEYENGYYVMDAPFNLSEIKIILDSISSLKNLDNSLMRSLNNKLLSFISYDEEKLLNSISYSSNHKDTKLLQHMEDILKAISNKVSIEVSIKNKDKQTEIFPVFLYRQNDYYYIYYHYPNSNKLYHYRFDKIKTTKLLETKDLINIDHKTIIKHINSSTNAYSKGNSEKVDLIIKNNDEYIYERLLDEFQDATKTKNGITLFVDINDVFYSKLTSYGNNITITNKKVAQGYLEYLQSIINNY